MASPSKPARKVSEALLAFARPWLEALPASAGPEEIEQACQTPWLVWNAVVLDRLGRPTSALADARALIEASAPAYEATIILGLIAELERRKRAEVPPDDRVLGDVTAFRDEQGVVRLRVSQVAAPGTSPRRAR